LDQYLYSWGETPGDAELIHFLTFPPTSNKLERHIDVASNHAHFNTYLWGSSPRIPGYQPYRL
jgi:hypothetical protein